MTIRKSATENGFIIFKDQLSLLKLIPDEQLGKSIKLLLENFDELPEKDDIAYEMIATNVRRYREQAIKSRECGLLGGNPTLMGGDNDTLKLQEKKKQNKTRKEKNINNIIPSLQDVIDYCNERNNGVDANRWYDYYTANGWKVGRVPMKDWKATVRTWERKQNERGETHQEPMVLIEQGKFYIDDTMPEYADIIKFTDNAIAEKCWQWIYKNFYGKELKISFIRERLKQFKEGEQQ